MEHSTGDPNPRYPTGYDGIYLVPPVLGGPAHCGTKRPTGRRDSAVTEKSNIHIPIQNMEPPGVSVEDGPVAEKAAVRDAFDNPATA